MDKLKEKKEYHYQSLYDVFELGDRVLRNYRDKYGNYREYRGIVLAINDKSIEVYWDTLNGRFLPDNIDVVFTNLEKNEIYLGTKKYTPIKKYYNVT